MVEELPEFLDLNPTKSLDLLELHRTTFIEIDVSDFPDYRPEDYSAFLS